MKTGRATSPDDIPIEAWKCLVEVVEIWLTKVFNKIIMTKKMTDAWRIRVVVPIYKNKGDKQNCTNYRGIKFMSHSMKLREREMKKDVEN